jgi:hypothetical protein
MPRASRRRHSAPRLAPNEREHQAWLVDAIGASLFSAANEALQALSAIATQD